MDGVGLLSAGWYNLFCRIRVCSEDLKQNETDDSLNPSLDCIAAHRGLQCSGGEERGRRERREDWQTRVEAGGVYGQDCMSPTMPGGHQQNNTTTVINKTTPPPSSSKQHHHRHQQNHTTTVSIFIKYPSTLTSASL